MNDLEFKPWPKMARHKGTVSVISEKIDGTNACIVIQEGEVIAVQSRKRFITPEDDNYGFAGWVYRNEEELLKLGDGHHFGEWAGLGIQKNPLGLEQKEFFLFNTLRWGEHNKNTPSCCNVVATLFKGVLMADTVDNVMEKLKEDRDYEPEGVIIFNLKSEIGTKVTYKHDKGKWSKED